MLEELGIEGLKLALTQAVTNEEFEKATYITHLMGKKREEPTYSMDRDKQISVILDEFNFERVEKTMAHLGWFWVSKIEFGKGEDGKLKIINSVETQPHSDEIMKKAYDLLKEVWDKPANFQTCSITSGGLQANREIWGGKKILGLKFVLSNWDMDYDGVSDPDYS